MRILGDLQPEKVFFYFEELARIPHGSRNTKAISDYLASFAKEHGLEHYQDACNNIVIIEEASLGYESVEPVIIQGHMDMVCEKEDGCDIDFEKDALRLYVDGDFVRARGTTLGGDDGIAVAYALAILDSPELAHPRLEIVITVDEEIGMLGADSIDLSMLKGHRMLNIDSDVEGQFLVSCAGGMSVVADIPIKRVRMSGICITVTVDGLQGGHSGGEIDKERANASLVMGRFLRRISKLVSCGLISLEGGLKDNAIPRSCKAKLLISGKEKGECNEGSIAPGPDAWDDLFMQIGKAAAILEQQLSKELSISDPGVAITLSKGDITERDAIDFESLNRIVFFLRTVPNGVQNMSIQLPGLVEASLNLGIIKLTQDSLHAVISIRSSISSRKEDLCDRVCGLVEMLGGRSDIEGSYPAWEYKEVSPLRKQVGEVYSSLFGKEPQFDAIHAGLECGIFSEKIPNLDCVSFGPTNYDIHTPKERLSISSTRRYWDFLVEFLRQAK